MPIALLKTNRDFRSQIELGSTVLDVLYRGTVIAIFDVGYTRYARFGKMAIEVAGKPGSSRFTRYFTPFDLT